MNKTTYFCIIYIFLVLADFQSIQFLKANFLCNLFSTRRLPSIDGLLGLLLETVMVRRNWLKPWKNEGLNQEKGWKRDVFNGDLMVI
jgi:hypothetical protein